MNKIQLIAAAFLFFAGILVLPAKINAIGMASDPIIIENALRGSQYNEDISIINNSLTDEATFDLTAGGAAKDWVSFFEKDSNNKIDKVTIPAKSKKSVKVVITVPKTAANGEYEGQIVATSEAGNLEQGSTGSAVKLRVTRPITITITDKENIGIKATILPATYSVGKDSPLQLNVIYENTGNVEIAPSLQLKISKDGNSVFNAIFPYPEKVALILPAERKTIEKLVEWQTVGQGLGDYLVEAAVFVNGKSLQGQKFTFKITEKNNTNQPLASVSSAAKSDSLYVYYIIGAILVLAVIIFAVKKALKNKQTKQAVN
jgi:uncharacterized membrane protein